VGLRGCLLFTLITVSLAAAAENGRSREYWIAIRESDFALPAGAQPFQLLVEMNDLLASTDPVLRDDVAYSAAARWIYRKRLLTAAEERQLLELWRGNLTAGIGERGTDSVLRRSFSALNLSLLAALDNETPFMTQEDFDRTLAAALEYLERERDTRGYEPTKGWMHAAGHTADLLKFLARSPRLAREDQRRLLDAVAAKCAAFGEVFAWGEDERLAQVVRSLARRPDLDSAALESWLATFPEQNEALWSAAPAIEIERYVAVRNVKAMLRAAHAALAMDADLEPSARAAETKLLETLAQMR
jgi:hypothetical protein